MSLKIFTLLLLNSSICIVQCDTGKGIKNWQNFQHSLAKGDIDSVASMVKFPLISNEFGNKKNSINSKKEFKLLYKNIFTPYIIRILCSSTPKLKSKKNSIYSVFCDPQDNPNELPLDFRFLKIGETYWLTGIDNINE